MGNYNKLFHTSIKIVLLICISLLLLGLSKRPEIEEIKIGWIGVLSGDVAYYGKMVKAGTELAVDEINSHGGIEGKTIKVIYEDDQILPKLGVSALQKLINAEKVPVVIQAAGSSVMLAQAPVAEKNKVVLISPTVSNYKIKDAGDYIFRTWPSDAYQGKTLAEFVISNLKQLRVAIVSINNDYGIGLQQEFKRSFEDAGGVILATDSFNPGATDFRTLISKLNSIKPSVVLLASHYRESALFLKQAKELNFSAILIGGDGNFAPELIKLSRGGAEGMYVSNLHWDLNSSDSVVKNFVETFRKQFHKDPEVYGAAGYDCMMVLSKAIQNGGYNSEGIKKALYKIKNFKGVTGVISFDEYGEVGGKYNIFKVEGNQFVKIK